MATHNKILILDFGSQFTQLIARRTRELGVYSEIHPFDYSINKIKADLTIKAIILSGGPNSVYEKDAPDIDIELLELGIPILGTCYGMQLIAHKYGGKVESAGRREYGQGEINIVKDSLLTKGLPASASVWMSHGDHLINTPVGFQQIISSVNCPYSGIANVEKKLYGVQFHPEVYHSGEVGKALLANFLFEVAKVKADWNANSFIEERCQIIREQVGNGKVLCGLSGGVDSAVAAGIINKAVGDQIHCVFVDTGLLRMNEKQQVEEAFRGKFSMELTVVDASELFLGRLKGVTDPESKRKIIGKSFIDVFDMSKNYLENKEIRVSVDMSVKVIR